MSKKSVYFITGIDTGVGKTFVTGLMARFLEKRGLDWISLKMVQTGNTGFSEDLDLHRSFCGGRSFPEDGAGLTAPQIFAFPSSPRLAARLEKRNVDLVAIDHAVAECSRRHDIVLVEGAGGLCVPLTGDCLSIDFAAARDWRTVLVTCGRLGAINHALLSLEALRSRQMPLAGVVHNFYPDADPIIDNDTVGEIREQLQRSGMPDVLVRVPQINPELPLPDIDFSSIFNL
ncbi:MAG: dethiobiotin synthase [Opitutales bacterium]|nr:dethiobiotin synthase [Opitutales bacterium]